ncbi:MAG: MATE family efflux transporter [Lachnospiraceae bacterium]|nr:MATE family efflux transporter [Lachnospiraceae bacterium]
MKQKIDFVNGETVLSLLKMALPLLAATVLMLAYSLVDSIWVGNLLGENGYAALTTAGSVSLLLYALTTGISNGTSIIISQLIGAGDKKKTDEMIGTSLFISVIFSVSLVVLLELFLNRILMVFQTPAGIYTEAKSYLAIFLIGYVPVNIYMQLTSIYRSFGDPVFQMKGMLLGTLINLVIDPLFIKAFDISGAAVATVISQVICLAYALFYGKKKAFFTLTLKGLSMKKAVTYFKTVLPASAQNCIPAASSMIMVILVNRFDVTTIAAYGVVKNIENMLFYPAMAMNMALITIIGQLYGAKKYDRIRDYIHTAVKYGALIEIVLTGLVLVFSKYISMAFVKEAAVAGIVSHGLMIISVGYLCYMITCIFTAKLSGMGRVNLSMMLMFIYYIVIRVPLAEALIRGSLGLDGMWTAFLVSHLVATLMAYLISRSPAAAPYPDHAYKQHDQIKLVH